MSSADPDFVFFRAPFVREDHSVSGGRLEVASSTPSPSSHPGGTTRARHSSRLVRVLVTVVVTSWALWALGPEALTTWAVSAAVTVLLVARTTFTPKLDVASEVAYVKRTSALLLVLLLVLTLSGAVPLEPARVVFAAGVVSALTLLLVAGLQGLREPPRRILLVGDRKAVGDLISQWHQHPSVDIRGVCLDDESAEESGASVDGVAVLGTLGDVSLLAERHGIDQVVVAPGPRISAYDVRRLTWGLEHGRTALAVAAEVHGATPHRIAPELIGRRLVLAVSTPRPGVVHRAMKAAIDRGVGLALLALVAPVLIGIAVWVRVDSPGPALFRQVRTGIGGRAFTMYKLRTMHVDAEERLAELQEMNDGAGLLFKLRNDPRITRAGRTLRRTSLDELPQLINVVRGEMSLIGPRPGLPSETEAYDEWIARRLRVKPGMTGLWQVSGRSNLGWHESVRLDLDYVDNQTLRDEFAIAYKTLRAVIQRDGAM
ncbi:sugar transferase [Solicola sp. PLA-1-18]|uniref:sugar transferase n=1 Tax=Solicola sp. PLA-1-18 TaxID=3380532 RepID=UPI003B7D1F57